MRNRSSNGIAQPLASLMPYGCGILFTRVAPACRTAVNRHRSRDTTGYMPQAETSPRIRAEGSHPSCGTNCAKRVLKCEKLSFFVDRTLKAGERTQRGRQYAAVVQRQYTSLPNWERGFDSRLWLHMGANACPCHSEGPGRTRLLPNLRDPHGSCAGSCGAAREHRRWRMQRPKRLGSGTSDERGCGQYPQGVRRISRAAELPRAAQRDNAATRTKPGAAPARGMPHP